MTSVISDVGRALRTLLGPRLPTGTALHFTAPTGAPRPGRATAADPGGAGGMSGRADHGDTNGNAAGADGSGGADPGCAVHLVLAWVRDDPSGRQSGAEDVRAADGSLLGRQSPAKRYELRYLVTARAADPEREHELLDAVLLAVTDLDALPADCLPKSLADAGLPVRVQVCSAAPPPTADLPAHAGFALLVNAPLLPPLQTALAPPAAELSMGLQRTVPKVPAATGDGRQWRRARIDEG